MIPTIPRSKIISGKYYEAELLFDFLKSKVLTYTKVNRVVVQAIFVSDANHHYIIVNTPYFAIESQVKIIGIIND